MVTRSDVPDAVSKNTVCRPSGGRPRGLAGADAFAGTFWSPGADAAGVYATKHAMDWAEGDPVRAHVLTVLAAKATVGRNAVASYHSAALLHRLSLLKPPPRMPWRSRSRWPSGGTGHRPADVVFHASDLPPEHVTRLSQPAGDDGCADGRGSGADAAVHGRGRGGGLGPQRGEGDTTKPELHQILEECAGWPGVRQARHVIDFADERAESPLESAARVVFEQRGLDPPELQATIHGPNFAFRVDFLWRGQRVIAEADGLVKYNDRKDLLAERERDHRLGEAGYTVVHFTWRELFQTPEVVIAHIRGPSPPPKRHPETTRLKGHRPKAPLKRHRPKRTPPTQDSGAGLRQSIVGRSASARTRFAYRLVIENSDSISVSDSRCGSRPRSMSAVCVTL